MMPTFIQKFYNNQLPDRYMVSMQTLGGVVAGLVAWNPYIVAPVIVANVATSVLAQGIIIVGARLGYQISSNDENNDLFSNIVKQAVVSALSAAVVVPMIGSLFGVTLNVSIAATVAFGVLVNGLLKRVNVVDPQAFCYLPAPFLATLTARLAQARGLIA